MARNNLTRFREAAPRFTYGYVIVLSSLLIILTNFILRYAFGVFFKPIQIEFDWTRALTSGAFSLSWLIEGLLGITAGWLSDKYGPRIVLSLCGVFVGLGCVLMSQISEIWQLYIFYGVMIAIGTSGIRTPVLATIARWFEKKRGMMTGIVLTGTGFSLTIGAPLATWLISSYGWRNAFIIVGSIIFFVIVLASQFIKRDPSCIGQEPYGYDKNKRNSPNEIEAGFSLREAASTRQFWLIFSVFFFFGFCAFVVLLHMVPHATDMGISAVTAANILALWGGLMILGRIVLGSIADKIGARQIFIFGFVIFSVCLFFLANAKDLWSLYILSVLMAFAQGGMGACESILTAEVFGLKALGIILGALCVGFTLGAGIGPLIAGYIFDISGKYDMAFILTAILCIVGLISTLLIKTDISRSN